MALPSYFTWQNSAGPAIGEMAVNGRFDLRRFSQARMTANGKFAALPKILRCGSEGFLRQQ